MTPTEFYEKFIANSREPTTVYSSGSHSTKVLGAGIYKLKRARKETFSIKQKDDSITIFDKDSNVKS